MTPRMWIRFAIALLLILPTTPISAQVGTDACVLARQVSLLESAYRVLLQSPDMSKSRQVAISVKALAQAAAQDAPAGIREALGELGDLADSVYRANGFMAIDAETRARHLQNAIRLGAWQSPADCPDPEPRQRTPSQADGDSDAEGGDQRDANDDRDGPADRDRSARLGGASLSIRGTSLGGDLGGIIGTRNLLIVFSALALCGAAWLTPMAVEEIASRLPSVTRGPSGRKPWYALAFAKLAKNRRRAPHHVLGRFFDVTPVGSEKSKRVKVADISLNGAKLAWTGPPPSGTCLHLNLDGIGKDAAVVWTNAHFCGVMFDTELAEAELKMILVRPEAPTEVSGELEMF